MDAEEERENVRTVDAEGFGLATGTKRRYKPDCPVEMPRSVKVQSWILQVAGFQDDVGLAVEMVQERDSTDRVDYYGTP